MCTEFAMYGVGWFSGQVLDITPVFLTSIVLSTLGKVDYVASQVRKAELRDSDYGVWHKI
jgi:hypothetical protein